MRTPRIFFESTPAPGETIELDSDNSRYLTRVLRRKPGDPVVLFNGDGNDYHASITAVAGVTRVQIESVLTNPTESPLNITLVQSLAKGAKLDLVVQKATELGVCAIEPVSNDRSILQIHGQKQQRKLDHWQKIAISACAQCNRSRVPRIEPAQSFEQWLSSPRIDTTLLLDPAAEATIPQVCDSSLTACTVLVGPEGGFSHTELASAREHQIVPVRFGPRVLRTETAGLAAIAVLQALFGDLR